MDDISTLISSLASIFPSQGKVPKLDHKLTPEEKDGIAEWIAALIYEMSGVMHSGKYADMTNEREHDLEVCDMYEKEIKKIANSDAPLSNSDISLLMMMAGRDNKDFNLDDYQNWDDGMVGKYAEHLKNYLYTYKDEATNVDPSIDPNEEHVGPMAQDIEQVAPDCVKETPEGVKVVNGDRLALVNAGVIGDLSREVIELRSRLSALESRV